MKNLLKKYFGYDYFRDNQEEIVNNIINKKDTFVLMPTGGGKSLCYQLPALKFDGVTLVVSPLIALMKDQVDALKSNGVKAAFINSSLSYAEIDQIMNDLKNNKIKILYVAPERLATNNFKLFLTDINLSLIAIDEAHCISQWGHDFRPDYRNLSILKKMFPATPLVALTATATEKVRNDILKQLHLTKANTFISSFDRANLNLQVVNKKNALNKLINILKTKKGDSVIIYCFSRKDTEKITNTLNSEGFKACAYHAGLDPSRRKKAQNDFIKDRVNIVVATIAFGMGIDKPDVRLVVHYTFPKSIEGYYQEIGRAGRDGLPADCIMFYTYADLRKHEFFWKDKEPDVILQEKKKIEEMLDYAQLNTCRRKYLLEYFNETFEKDNCGSCDTCLNPQKKFDATIITQKILSAIIRTGNRFGLAYIASVLKGSKKQQILNNRHEKLSVHGIVNDFSEDSLKNIIRSLITLGYIKKDDGEYPTISVSQKGIQFLQLKKTIELIEPKTKEVSVSKKTKESLDYNQDLFQQLRAIRKELAEQKNIPPFVIFGDTTLQEMAYYLPTATEQLSYISGVGEVKLNTFGESFLSIIKNFVNQNDLTSIEIPFSQRRKKGKITNVKGETYKTTEDMLKRGLTIPQISKLRNITESTILNHITELIKDGKSFDLSYMKPDKETFDQVSLAFDKCGLEALKPVHEYLEEKYDYEVLKLVRLILINKK